MSDWIEVKIPFGPVTGYKPGSGMPEEMDSMMKRGLIVVGTLLEFEDGEQLLVGNINVMGGTCDDCYVGKDRIVLRYLRVWAPPGPPEVAPATRNQKDVTTRRFPEDRRKI